MKNKFLVLSVLLCLVGCSNEQKKQNEQFYVFENISLNFSTSKKYLLLPVEDTAEELQATIWVDDKKIDTYVLRIAQNSVDYWVPVELSAWKNQEVSLKLNKAAAFLKEAQLSDSFDFEYNEKYRPACHFTPLYGWMNDPNGMVYYAGEYHLFYQHNPYGTRWQNMSWGHAVSTDLVHWEHLPVALKPDSLGTIFSGSCVVDENNTAGFQTGNEKTLLAFYTQSERGGQWQSLAYSNDKGRTWTKYDKNPVLKKENAPDFRDPKVFWYSPENKWVMILAVGQVMEIYSSTNVKEWTYQSSFGNGYGAHGGTWECPDLFELDGKWVLICNINPGGPSGGSATQYFVGDFDGRTFQCDLKPEETRWLDWGKDHYAMVSWANAPDNRRLAIAWMNNWEYANDVPTQNFRSATTVSRELKLLKKGDNYMVTNYPAKEMESLRKSGNEWENLPVQEDYTIDKLLENNQGTYELLLNIENQSAEIIGFKLFNTQGEHVDFHVNLSEKKCYIIDRKNSGQVAFNDRFPTVTSAPVAAKKTYQLRLLVDKASIESFLDAGEVSMTNLIFPAEPYNRIGFYAKGGGFTVKKLTVYELNKIP
jgi:fructan beta-fructosidase